MANVILVAALVTASWSALLRVAWCVVGFVRMFRNHSRAAVSKWGWVQVAVVPEAYILGAAALVLWLRANNGGAPTAAGLSCAIAGAGLSVSGVLVSVWTFLTFPTIGTGHYISEGQTIVIKGPYAWVRHPTYLGVLLLWFGLGLAYRTIPLLVLASCYALIYQVYARAEEEMLTASFGEPYRNYCSRVGRFLPRSLQPFRAA